jgi:hypothetical protein
LDYHYFLFFYLILIFLKEKIKKKNILNMGIGDWGLGSGVWGLGPKPQNP